MKTFVKVSIGETPSRRLSMTDFFQVFFTRNVFFASFFRSFIQRGVCELAPLVEDIKQHVLSEKIFFFNSTEKENFRQYWDSATSKKFLVASNLGN